MSDQFDSFDAHTDAIIDEFQNLTSDTIGAIKSANDWLRGANAIWSFYKSISGNFEGKNGFNEGTYGHRYTVYKRNMLQTSLSEVKKLFTISFEPYYSIPESPNIDGLKNLLVDIESERVSRAESALGLTNKPKTDDLDFFVKVVDNEIEKCQINNSLEGIPTVTDTQSVIEFIRENQSKNVHDFIETHPMPGDYRGIQARYIEEINLEWQHRWKAEILRAQGLETLNWEDVRILKRSTFKTYFIEEKRVRHPEVTR